MKVLDITNLASKDPFKQFSAWHDEAIIRGSEFFDPDAMTVATANKEGVPSARMMSLRGFDERGFNFYGNYGSRWGRDLEENPKASIQFYWEPMKRSIRMDGRAEKMSSAESDEYFRTRAECLKIGALVSHQSKPIASRDDLHDQYLKLQEEYKNKTIPRPAEWGGYRFIPETYEFWAVQVNRLHDRIRFRRLAPGEKVDNKFVYQAEKGWVMERLSP